MDVVVNHRLIGRMVDSFARPIQYDCRRALKKAVADFDVDSVAAGIAHELFIDHRQVIDAIMKCPDSVIVDLPIDSLLNDMSKTFVDKTKREFERLCVSYVNYEMRNNRFHQKC